MYIKKEERNKNRTPTFKGCIEWRECNNIDYCYNCQICITSHYHSPELRILYPPIYSTSAPGCRTDISKVICHHLLPKICCFWSLLHLSKWVSHLPVAQVKSLQSSLIPRFLSHLNLIHYKTFQTLSWKYSRIQPLLTSFTSPVLVQTTVISQIKYSKSLLMISLTSLQSIITEGPDKSKHTIPLLKILQRLPSYSQ